MNSHWWSRSKSSVTVMWAVDLVRVPFPLSVTRDSTWRITKLKFRAVLLFYSTYFPPPLASLLLTYDFGSRGITFPFESFRTWNRCTAHTIIAVSLQIRSSLSVPLNFFLSLFLSWRYTYPFARLFQFVSRYICLCCIHFLIKPIIFLVITTSYEKCICE